MSSCARASSFTAFASSRSGSVVGAAAFFAVAGFDGDDEEALSLAARPAREDSECEVLDEPVRELEELDEEFASWAFGASTLAMAPVTDGASVVGASTGASGASALGAAADANTTGGGVESSEASPPGAGALPRSETTRPQTIPSVKIMPSIPSPAAARSIGSRGKRRFAIDGDEAIASRTKTGADGGSDDLAGRYSSTSSTRHAGCGGGGAERGASILVLDSYPAWAAAVDGGVFLLAPDDGTPAAGRAAAVGTDERRKVAGNGVGRIVTFAGRGIA